jgi:hypothetical protein
MGLVEQTILILILLSGPGEREVGELLAQELRERGGQRVEVVVGEPAHQGLEERWGIRAEDLVVSRHIGEQLTAHEERLVLLHVNGREMSGDQILEVGLWVDGRSERVSSIAGAGANPVPGLLSSLMPLLQGVLPKPTEAAGAANTKQDVASLIKGESWVEALAALAGKEQLSAREHYYRVLAYVRLGNRSAAIAALNQMLEAHGQHFLTKAAEDLIPALSTATLEAPSEAPAEELPAELDPAEEAVTP